MAHAAQSTVQHGNRSFNRLRLRLPADLILTHERRACELVNVSASGALVRGDKPIARGTTLVLCFHLLRIYSVVSWTRENFCGLRFDKPLDLEDMQGFLWITQNREEYERICREELLEGAYAGFGR